MVMRRSWIVILALLLISPIFGIYLADLVGYHEPLDIAAELLGLKDVTEEISWTPFLDYSVPGLPPWLGYVVSGALGIAVILVIGLLIRFIMREV